MSLHKFEYSSLIFNRIQDLAKNVDDERASVLKLQRRSRLDSTLFGKERGLLYTHPSRNDLHIKIHRYVRFNSTALDSGQKHQSSKLARARRMKVILSVCQ
jgi:hypothetical protein